MSAPLVCLEIRVELTHPLNWSQRKQDTLLPSSTVLYLFYRAVIFIFCHFFHIIWLNYLSSLKNKKFEWIIQFEKLVIIECN